MPYTEISLTKFPDKRAGLFVLTRRSTTPQAFFNTRHVGGYDSTLKELKNWDRDRKFANALEKYNAQIEKFPSPSNPHLAVPVADEAETDAGTISNPSLPSERKTVQLNLPSGIQTYTVWALTNWLSSILPLSNLHYHLMTYKQSVTGAQATTALAKHFSCTREQAEDIGKDLHALGLLHHVTYGHDFMDTPKYYYRLQCHQTPHIINTLYLCDGEDEIGDDTVKTEALVERVERILETITKSCLVPGEKKGGIQYKRAARHCIFGELQETVCCFQSVTIDHMEPKTLLAFGLNVYNIMLQFAFFKLGLPEKETNQQAFLRGTKFIIGGKSYSFHQWLGAISRGNVGGEPDTRDSLRTSLLVPNRPIISPKARSSLGTETSPEGSESQSSIESPTGRRPFRNSQVETRSNTRGRSPPTKDSTLIQTSEDLNIADYRIYFATHFFWSRASAVAHFTPENLDKELDIMAFAFCENDANVHVDEKKGELHLSNIFTVYRKHFGDSSAGRGDSMSDSYAASAKSDSDLAKIVCKFVESTKKLQLQKLRSSSGTNAKLKLSFHQDTWTTNAAKKEYMVFKPSLIDANCARF